MFTISAMAKAASGQTRCHSVTAGGPAFFSSMAVMVPSSPLGQVCAIDEDQCDSQHKRTPFFGIASAFSHPDHKRRNRLYARMGPGSEDDGHGLHFAVLIRIEPSTRRPSVPSRSEIKVYVRAGERTSLPHEIIDARHRTADWSRRHAPPPSWVDECRVPPARRRGYKHVC